LVHDIWHACDIMRRDDGTTEIKAYLTQISWLIFLKVFENIEDVFEYEHKIRGDEYERIIKDEYRWSNWTKKDLKGDELINFIDKKLFPHLSELEGSREREIVATIFKQIKENKMKSGFDLKEVIQLISQINFNNAEDSHIISQIYEELLLKLGKEGGIAGEFYTPRPIVRTMVKIVNPQIGETVYDPFVGSGGFLVESYKHMMLSKDMSVEDYKILQYETFYGQEKGELPYILGIMNCILHRPLGINIKRKNTLTENMLNTSEYGRFDVILTNPPFGGKENRQIQHNFPFQSQKTELLALQYVMKQLKPKGRCGIVLPDSILARDDDTFLKVKKNLVENFNLHTVVSLPSGVFANVSASSSGPKTNLLFFEKGKPTSEIWFYELKHPKGKSYTRSNTISDLDLNDCLSKFNTRSVSDNSWTVDIRDIIKRNYDLTAVNPKIKEYKYVSPDQLIANILEKEKQMQSILENIQENLA
jgi:type I restriction enzyme M protein